MTDEHAELSVRGEHGEYRIRLVGVIDKRSEADCRVWDRVPGEYPDLDAAATALAEMIERRMMLYRSLAERSGTPDPQ